jgi:hypothetical protein
MCRIDVLRYNGAWNDPAGGRSARSRWIDEAVEETVATHLFMFRVHSPADGDGFTGGFDLSGRQVLAIPITYENVDAFRASRR